MEQHRRNTVAIPFPLRSPSFAVLGLFGVSKTLESRWELRGFAGSLLA